MTFNGESRTRVVRPRSDAWNVRGSSSSGGQGGSRWRPPPSSAALTFPSNAVAADRHFPLCCYPSVVVLMRSHVLLLSCHLLPNLLPYSYQNNPSSLRSTSIFHRIVAPARIFGKHYACGMVMMSIAVAELGPPAQNYTCRQCRGTRLLTLAKSSLC